MRRRDVLRWGVVGCGRIFPYYAQTIVHHPEAELVAVCDTDVGRAVEAMGEYAPDVWVADYRELLARDDVDAVAVCTRGADHQKIVSDSLNAGKFVFCESPVLCSDISEEQAAKFGAAAPLRYDPAIRALRSGVNEGEFGEILRTTVTVGKGCEGALLGAIDLLMWIMGEPERIGIRDREEQVPGPGAMLEDVGIPPTTLTAVAAFGGERVGFIHTADDTGFGCLVSVVGSEGVAWAHEGRMLTMPMEDRQQEIRTVETMDAPWLMAIYLRMIWDFNSCCLHGREYWLGWEWVQAINGIARRSGLIESLGTEHEGVSVDGAGHL